MVCVHHFSCCHTTNLCKFVSRVAIILQNKILFYKIIFFSLRKNLCSCSDRRFFSRSKKTNTRLKQIFDSPPFRRRSPISSASCSNDCNSEISELCNFVRVHKISVFDPKNERDPQKWSFLTKNGDFSHFRDLPYGVSLVFTF